MVKMTTTVYVNGIWIRKYAAECNIVMPTVIHSEQVTTVAYFGGIGDAHLLPERKKIFWTKMAHFKPKNRKQIPGRGTAPCPDPSPWERTPVPHLTPRRLEARSRLRCSAPLHKIRHWVTITSTDLYRVFQKKRTPWGILTITSANMDWF